MRRAGLALVLVLGRALAAQDAYFKEPERKWWLPQWELNAWRDDIDRPGKPAILRDRSRLRLRWQLGADDSWIQLKAGSAHYLASDGNRNNLARFDNEPSNGTRLDLADLRMQWVSAKGGLELHGGLVENGLVTTESNWDSDLRVIGGSGRIFFRAPEGSLEELGLRATSGDVRLLDGGRVRMNAFQGILKVSAGSVSWTFFGGPWNLKMDQQDLARFQRQNPSNYPYYPEGGADYSLSTYGVAVSGTEGLPFEIKAQRHTNRDTKEKGGELQVFLGSRTRKWHPQVGWVRQILAPTSQLAAINGDIWWFHANADGSRYLVALPLPKKWLVQGSYIEQRLRTAKDPVKSYRFDLVKRF